MPSVLLTGCSTGIGHAACELFAQRGWTVYAGSRHPHELTFAHPTPARRSLGEGGIFPSLIDVNDSASIDLAFKNLPPLDCVVNNAGYGLLLPFEDTPPEEIRKLFETNVFGLMEVSRCAARMMREKKSGTIINISSVLGTIGMPWYAAYGATKWAVEGFSESLAHELRPFGVHVKIVEPGGTKTRFHDTAYDSIHPPITEAYRERYGRKQASHGSKNDYDPPERVAELIYSAATDTSWRLRHSASQARQTLFWQRVLGRDGLWKRLV